MSTLLPAERGLTKPCTACSRKLTLDHYYIRAKRLTQDGRWYRASKCIACYQSERAHRRGQTSEERLALEAARRRAQRRLAAMCPELFAPLFEDEKRNAGLIGDADATN